MRGSRARAACATVSVPVVTPAVGGGRQSADAGQRSGARQGDRGFVPERGGGVSTPVQAGEFPSRRARPSLVFVAENGIYKPRIVRLGVGNFDYTEVVSGLKEGEQVALLAAAAMQAKREEQNNRMRRHGRTARASRSRGRAAALPVAARPGGGQARP